MLRERDLAREARAKLDATPSAERLCRIANHVQGRLDELLAIALERRRLTS
ncbi:MAG: hypothetical protein U1E63_01560 [Burkholderiales bacterium]